MDNAPGDRRSTCHARMKPIGLTYKSDGELMIVHLCLGCGKISSNRIAGDDNAQSIMTLLETSITLGNAISSNVRNKGVVLLTRQDEKAVHRCLYGDISRWG